MNAAVIATQKEATEALFEAIRKDDIDGFQAALAAGALVDAPNLVGDYPLHLVAENGNQEMFGRLRRMGADADVSDGQGWLPVHRAVRAGQPEMAQALMEYSAALNAELDMEGAPEAGRNDSEATGEWKSFGDVEKAIKAASSVEDLISTVEKADALYMRDEEPLQVSDEEWKRLTQLVVEKKNELDGNVENTIRPAVRTEVATNTPQQSVEGQADSIAPAKKSLLQAASTTAQRPKTLLGGKFIGDDKGNYRRIGEEKVSLVDEIERIRFIDKQMDTFQAAVELAKHKGWDAIEVTGSDRFRADAWYVARKAGLEVVGYEPTTKDLARLGEGVATDAPNLVDASRKEAERVALAKVGAVQGVDENAGRYVGKIVQETEHHVVQDIGRGMSAIHDKGKFPPAALREFESPEPLRIQYRAGQATVDATKQQERGATR